MSSEVWSLVYQELNDVVTRAHVSLDKQHSQASIAEGILLAILYLMADSMTVVLGLRYGLRDQISPEDSGIPYRFAHGLGKCVKELINAELASWDRKPDQLEWLTDNLP